LHVKFLAPLPGNCLFVKIDFCLNWFYFSTSLGRFFFLLPIFVSISFYFFLLYCLTKKKKFMSLYCSFGEIIYKIVLKHTNAKGTTCGRSVAKTLPKKIYIFGWFCEFLIFGVFFFASVLIFFFRLFYLVKKKRKKKLSFNFWVLLHFFYFLFFFIFIFLCHFIFVSNINWPYDVCFCEKYCC